MWFTQEFIDFFKELSANNEKEWFHANKKRYETHVKKPFYHFIETLLLKTGNDIPVKDAIFRINRDIRFSKNKSPYKNHVAGIISSGGRKNMQEPGLYIHFEVGNVMIAGGNYMPDKTNLSKIRQYIVDNNDEVQKALNTKSFVKMYGGLSEGEKNKILPKEFKAFGDRFPMLYNKQYYYSKTYTDEEFLCRNDLLDLMLKHYEVGEVWNGIIRKAQS